MRLRLDLSYDGSAFHGWAAQPGLRTVEGELTAALTLILRHDVSLTVAGRTDAGVHARHQVVHLDIDEAQWRALPGRSDRSPEASMVTRLMSLLSRGRKPKGTSDIVIHSAARAPEGFDARFSATGRRYIYRIDDREVPDVFASRYVWRTEPLDEGAMRLAVADLIGEHDFLSFCKPREGATTIRELRNIAIDRPVLGPDAGLLTLQVEADAFCHSMVRSLVGALVEVGRGRKEARWPGQLLARQSREQAAPLAPAHGLTLEAVEYPEESQLASQAKAARRVREKPATGPAPVIDPEDKAY